MHKFFKAGMLLGLSLSGIYTAVASSTTQRRARVAVTPQVAVRRLQVRYGQARRQTVVTCYPSRHRVRQVPVYRIAGHRHQAADGWIWRGNLPARHSLMA